AAHGRLLQVVGVAGVAAEGLVPPVARERHLDAAAGQPGDEERRDGGRVGEGLVVEAGQLVQQGDGVRGDDLLDVPGAVPPGHLTGVRQLAEGPLPEAPGEGLQRPARRRGARARAATTTRQPRPPLRRAPAGPWAIGGTLTASDTWPPPPSCHSPAAGRRSGSTRSCQYLRGGCCHRPPLTVQTWAGGNF